MSNHLKKGILKLNKVSKLEEAIKRAMKIDDSEDIIWVTYKSQDGSIKSAPLDVFKNLPKSCFWSQNKNDQNP